MVQTQEEPLTLCPGTMLGDYEVREPLARGGFGAVYRARQRRLSRDVVLKVVGPAADATRVRREVDLVRRLRHPNVVHLYDVGETAGGLLWMAMELVAGESLAQRLERLGALAPGAAHNVLLQILDALTEAHAKGIIHRDLKPENIMLTRVGARRDVVKLLDFGIAERLESFCSGHYQISETEQGEREVAATVFGTPRYLAPELLDGDLGAYNDVYAAGLIGVEMLTGEPLATGADDAEILACHLVGAARLPDWLEQSRMGNVLRCALARQPERRYADAGEFFTALEGVSGASLERLAMRAHLARAAHEEVVELADSEVIEIIEPELFDEVISGIDEVLDSATQDEIFISEPSVTEEAPDRPAPTLPLTSPTTLTTPPVASQVTALGMRRPPGASAPPPAPKTPPPPPPVRALRPNTALRRNAVRRPLPEMNAALSGALSGALVATALTATFVLVAPRLLQPEPAEPGPKVEMFALSDIPLPDARPTFASPPPSVGIIEARRRVARSLAATTTAMAAAAGALSGVVERVTPALNSSSSARAAEALTRQAVVASAQVQAAAARPAVPPPPKPALEPAVDEVVWWLRTTPRGAHVYLGNLELCYRTPCSVRLPRSRRPVTLRFKRYRYQEAQAELDVRRGGSIDLTLEPRVPRKAPPKPVADTPDPSRARAAAEPSQEPTLQPESAERPSKKARRAKRRKKRARSASSSDNGFGRIKLP